MYDYLKGTFIEAGTSANDEVFIIIEVGGIGYKCLTLAKSLHKLPNANETNLCKLYTSFIVREDAQILVGFWDKGERSCFELLIKASGVGLKSALSLLNSLSVSELTLAIMSGDYKKLTLAKGVGPKLAQKLVLELKDKMTGWRERQSDLADTNLTHAYSSAHASSQNTSSSESALWLEAETVLLSLGYSYQEINDAFQIVGPSLTSGNVKDASEILQATLKCLAKGQAFVAGFSPR